MTSKVAVYGTLKRGHGANSYLSNTRFVGGGVTALRYKMTDVGFPKIARHAEGHKVRVEVYDEPNWSLLDRYEGVPGLYRRSIIPVELDSGEVIDAYIYEANELSGRPVAPTGDTLVWG